MSHFFIPLVIRIWFSTIRVTIRGTLPTTPVIYAFWHEHIFAVVRTLSALVKRQPMTALVSGSPDGRRLQSVMQALGFHIATGSSTSNGASGLIGLRHALDSGRSVLITPDGPRGPAGSLKEGVIKLAEMSNRPIVAITVVYRKAWRLKSWDRAWLPKPFSSVEVTVHPPRSDAREPENLRQLLHDR